MFIFINEKHEIKAIHKTNDESLKKIEIDRDKVFGGYSDFLILNYCYKEDENGGYSTYPADNHEKLVNIDSQMKLIKVIEDIELIKQENEAQEKMIATLSYDLMMAQPVSKEFKTESSEHIAIKKWYEKGYWTKEMVQNAVMMNKITEEEYELIVKE